jgi:excisionase family DNA binding protein
MTATYTTGELARRLGLNRYQLNYLIEAGHIPEPQTRSSGRRLFNEEEARKAELILQQRRCNSGLK